MSICGGGSVPDTSTPITNATNQATALEQQMYQQERSDLAPWREAGTGAVNYLSGMLVPNAQGQLTTDPTNALRSTPGYQFARDQGVNALELGAASRGNLLSGAQQKGLETFGTGLADQTYQNYLSNLFTVSGSGEGAAATTGQAGMQYANQAGQNYLTAAEAQNQNALQRYQAQQSGYNSLGSLIGAGAGILAAPFTGGTSLIGTGLAGLNALTGGWGGGGTGSGYNYASPYSMSSGTYNALGGSQGLSY